MELFKSVVQKSAEGRCVKLFWIFRGNSTPRTKPTDALSHLAEKIDMGSFHMGNFSFLS